MEALMILAGGLLLVLGWFWLVIAAIRLSVGRMLVALFLAPLTLFLRGRGYPTWPRLLLLLGIVSLVVGTLELQRQQPERLDLLLSGHWSAAAPATSDLQGTIMGQPFVPERIVWRGADLVFEEGPPERLRRVLTIRFAGARSLLQEPVVQRLPGDEGEWPELVLQWYSGALAAPGLRKVVDDYSLSLDFGEPVQGRVEGRIHLHLPTIYSTWLTGRIELASVPPWLLEREQAEQLAQEQAAAHAAAAVAREEGRQPGEEKEWQELSLLALIDEPALFSGSAVRLTTWSGRVHLGTFRELSAEQRLILAQARGADQVELHFHPLDIRMIESRATP